MDEISICAPTTVSEMRDGQVSTYQIDPSQFGLKVAKIDEIKVDSAAASLAIINDILDGEAGAARDIVVLNAAAGIYVSGITNSLQEAVSVAIESIDSGKAKQAKIDYVAATQVTT